MQLDGDSPLCSSSSPLDDLITFSPFSLSPPAYSAEESASLGPTLDELQEGSLFIHDLPLSATIHAVYVLGEYLLLGTSTALYVADLPSHFSDQIIDLSILLDRPTTHIAKTASASSSFLLLVCDQQARAYSVRTIRELCRLALDPTLPSFTRPIISHTPSNQPDPSVDPTPPNTPPPLPPRADAKVKGARRRTLMALSSDLQGALSTSAHSARSAISTISSRTGLLPPPNSQAIPLRHRSASVGEPESSQALLTRTLIESFTPIGPTGSISAISLAQPTEETTLICLATKSRIRIYSGTLHGGFLLLHELWTPGKPKEIHMVMPPPASRSHSPSLLYILYPQELYALNIATADVVPLEGLPGIPQSITALPRSEKGSARFLLSCEYGWLTLGPNGHPLPEEASAWSPYERWPSTLSRPYTLRTLPVGDLAIAGVGPEDIQTRDVHGHVRATHLFPPGHTPVAPPCPLQHAVLLLLRPHPTPSLLTPPIRLCLYPA